MPDAPGPNQPWRLALDSIEFASAASLRYPARRIRAGLALLLAMTVVVLFTNDSAREYLKIAIGRFTRLSFRLPNHITLDNADNIKYSDSF